MSYYNVPADWDNFWKTCNKCNFKWHLSEGSDCDKCREEKEEKEECLQTHCINCKKKIQKEEDVLDLEINGEEGYEQIYGLGEIK